MKFLAVCLLPILAVVPRVAEGSTIVFVSDVAFSGTPDGPAPWLQATFDDAAVGAGFDVRLTLEAQGLTGNEFVRDWGFNLNPAINPAQLTFGDFDLTDVGGNGNVAYSTGTNGWATGGGLYDIHFAFPPANADRFEDGDIVVIDIDWTLGTLTAADFNFLASPGGGNGPFYTVTDIQTGGGGWVANGNDASGTCLTNETCTPFLAAAEVPEPASLVLLGSGLLAVASRLRKRVRK